MKTLHLIIIIALAFPVWLSAEVFKVVEVNGDVQYRAPKQFKSESVKANQELLPGGRIRITGDGTLTLSTPKNDNIKLSGDTYMRLEELSKTAAGEDVVKLELFKGVNRNQVHPLKGEEAFLIRTPVAVVGVRGTDFQCTVAESGMTEVNVFEGLVAVNDIGGVGAEVSLPKGQSASISSDGKVDVSVGTESEVGGPRIESGGSNDFEPVPLPETDVLDDIKEEQREVEEIHSTDDSSHTETTTTITPQSIER